MEFERSTLTVSEVSAITGIERHSILKMIRSGELPALNLTSMASARRKRYAVNVKDLEAFLESRRIPRSA